MAKLKSIYTGWSKYCSAFKYEKNLYLKLWKKEDLERIAEDEELESIANTPDLCNSLNIVNIINGVEFRQLYKAVDLIDSFTLGLHPCDFDKNKKPLLLSMLPTQEQINYFSRKGSRRKRREHWQHQFRNASKRHMGFELKTNPRINRELYRLYFRRWALVSEIRSQGFYPPESLTHKEKMRFAIRKERLELKIGEINKQIEVIECNPDTIYRGKKRIPLEKERVYSSKFIRKTSTVFNLNTEDESCRNSKVYSTHLPKEEVVNQGFSEDNQEPVEDYFEETFYHFKSSNTLPTLDEQESVRDKTKGNSYYIPKAYRGVWDCDLEDHEDISELKFISMKQASILMSKEPEYIIKNQKL